MKTIWIVGAKGRFGTVLCRRLAGTDCTLLPTDLDELDAADSAAVHSFAAQHKPDVIVNCAGLPRAACDDDPDAAYRANAMVPRNLAAEANLLGALLVQFSTDDVFDQHSSRPYDEFDAPCPHSVYGRSKLAGEEFVRTLCLRHLIIRSGWVYGVEGDFVSTVLNAAHDEGCPWLMVPTDCAACPTNADDLIDTAVMLMERGAVGLYHAVGRGWCSRYDFAREILRCAGAEKQLKLRPCYSEGKPVYSVLDNLMLRLENLPQPRPWREALAAYLQAER